ncbi:hypothetical protein Msi02_11050 [Microbispora siamensis]|uniref:Uncharacterized protein n=1 Tax=Microbispora siamensis TaxID=564413 RepID=A0ABQ4GFU1_9ACTN|nr:hypothetical protein Msi02_11050 [Microbispora siamensis]
MRVVRIRNPSVRAADWGSAHALTRVWPSVAGARWAVSPARYGTHAVPGRRDAFSSAGVQPRRAIDLVSR